MRPPRARREKPKVSAFISAKVDRIRDLRPDLVLGFSDLQADIAAQLVRLGLNVCVFNQRDVASILQMIRVLGGMIGCEAKADALATRLERGLDEVRATAARFEKRPRVYFEEWDEPMISGIRWVSELIGIAGGEDCFADNAQHALGKDRIIADPLEVVRRSPDIILGSWCGKKFRPDAVAARIGMGERAGGRAASAARDQVIDHPAARPRRADGRCARDPESDGGVAEGSG